MPTATCRQCGKHFSYTTPRGPVRLSTLDQEERAEELVFVTACPHCKAENRFRVKRDKPNP